MKLNIPYKIIRSKRTTASFEVRSGEVIIRVPKHLSDQQIAVLASDKMDWIQKQLLISKPSPKKQFIEGEMFKYRGKDYELHLVGEIQIRSGDNKIKITNKSPLQFLSDFYLHKDKTEDAKKYFEVWYKKQAHEYLLERLNAKAEIMRVKYTTLKITSPATRWGSCSTRGSVNLNWRLIMAPDDVIDYVIIHELSHLFEPNHSQRFWRKVEEFEPEYRIKKDWLKKNGSELSV